MEVHVDQSQIWPRHERKNDLIMQNASGWQLARDGSECEYCKSECRLTQTIPAARSIRHQADIYFDRGRGRAQLSSEGGKMGEASEAGQGTYFTLQIIPRISKASIDTVSYN